MPEIIRDGVSPDGSRWTIERDTPEEWAARPKMTFAQFVEMYPLLPERANDGDAYSQGFYRHTRCPDSKGCYGAEAEGASWCAPSEWHKLYFQRRKSVDPTHFVW